MLSVCGASGIPTEPNTKKSSLKNGVKVIVCVKFVLAFYVTMATTGILPTYQRFLNGAPVPASTRRSFRPREKYLILLVFLSFGLISFALIYYLPEFKSANRPSENSVYKVVGLLKSIQNAGPELLIPAPPHGEEVSDIPGKLVHGVLRHSVESHQDPHRLEDRAKLLAKINEEEKSGDKTWLEKPVVLKNSVSLSVTQTTKTVGDAGIKPVSLGQVDGAQLAVNLLQTVPPLESDHYPVIYGGEDKDPTARVRRDKVKEMMKHAWDSYVRYAWGKNELRPVSKRGHSGSIFGSASLGATIMDGLDTLYIMGLMDEFRQGRDWIADNYSLEQLSIDMSVFETNIRFVGGLLTSFALTGDVMFRDKAEHTAQKLLPAFQTQTGIPNALINTKTGSSKNYGWASGGASILSEFGTLSMEFGYLSDVTGNSVYRNKVDHIRQFLKGMEKPHGLYPNYLNPKTGKWGQHHMSMGALGDSYFEYLLKEWLRSGREDQESRQMYDEAMQAVMAHMLRTSAGGLMYFSDLKFDRLEHKMDHLACFSGGLLALGANTLKNELAPRYMEVAEGITNTCHESYDRTPTKLGPESFRFTEVVEAKAIRTADKYYILRPEVIESYFYMWRITKDPKYREWGWEAVQALQKHCWTPGGFTGIKNVYMEDSQKDDVQQSFFLAETLKYLYLLFSDDSLISLDEWVFNTEGHPLPIKGVNPYYRAAATPQT